jgi:hypothetical protein
MFKKLDVLYGVSVLLLELGGFSGGPKSVLQFLKKTEQKLFLQLKSTKP